MMRGIFGILWLKEEFSVECVTKEKVSSQHVLASEQEVRCGAAELTWYFPGGSTCLHVKPDKDVV